VPRLHPHRHPPLGRHAWTDDLLAWLIFGAVVALNVYMMWRIATATV